VIVPKAQTLSFEIADSKGNLLQPKSVARFSIETSDTAVVHLRISDLSLSQSYELRLRDGPGNVLDRRTFRALDLSPRRAKIAVASCLYDAYLEPSRAMWKSVQDEKPDLLFLIGDNVYAEVANGRFKSPMDEASLWTRYVETFLALDFFRWKQLVPTVVTWDDHDYGMKDGDATNPFKLESQKVLEAFFPRALSSEVPEFIKGPGLSSRFSAFGYGFFLLDNRSFRDLKTHFGAEQETWLFSNLKALRKPSWLISGDQWFGAYHRFESYEGRHPESLKTFLEQLRILKTSPVVFVSGDRHLSEVSKIESKWLGYETYEFTSSALHSKTYPSNWNTIPNPRQITGVDVKLNFMTFELQPPEKNNVQLKGAIIGANSEALANFEMSVRSKK